MPAEGGQRHQRLLRDGHIGTEHKRLLIVDWGPAAHLEAKGHTRGVVFVRRRPRHRALPRAKSGLGRSPSIQAELLAQPIQKAGEVRTSVRTSLKLT